MRARNGVLAAMLVLTAVPGLWADRNPAVLAEFDVYTDGDWLIIPVQVEGKTYRFVVDTGCSRTVIDSTLLRGNPVDTQEWKSSDGKNSKKFKFYQAPALKVGNINWQSSDMVHGEDLTVFRELSGHTEYGLLGMDFLSNYVVQIDFDKGKLRLLDSSARPEGTAVPIIFLDSKKSRPLVIGDIDGWGPEAQMIDTGDMGFGTLREKLFQALARNKIVQGLVEAKACTMLGIQENYGGRLEGFSIDRAPAIAMNVGGSPLDMGTLGIRFWRRYNVVFDFPRQTMYLQKSRCYAEDDFYNLSGFAWWYKGGNTVVMEVKEGSPAAQAGLKSGDVILKIAGKDASRTRCQELLKILSIKGTKVPVVYRRDQTQTEVILTLDPWKQKLEEPRFLKEAPTKKDRASLLVDRGFAYRLKNDADRALADFDEAIRLDPVNSDAFFYRAGISFDKKEYSQAVTYLNEAIRQKPKDPSFLWTRGQVLHAQGKLEKALEDFQECLRLDPKNPVAFKEMSRYYALKGDWEKALATVDEALRLSAWDAEALTCRAFCFQMLKQPDKAFKEYDRAIAIDPKCGLAYASRGVMRLNAGDYQRALADLNKGIELGSRTWEAYLARATVFHIQKNREGEVADLEEALRLDPNNSMAHHGLAWNLATGPENLRDGKRAITHAKKACELTEYRNPSALETLAAAHAEAGNFKEAVRWQKEAIHIYAGADILGGDILNARSIPVARNQTTELARRRLGSYERNIPTRE